MKIGGIDPSTLPNIETLVLPRGDERIVFTARGLPDMGEFDAMCPTPSAPVLQTKDGNKPNLKDSGFLKCMEEYNRKRLAYMVVRSLEPSQIEWDTVVLDNPSTWVNWEVDLKKANFSQVECNLVLGLCWEANQLDDAKLKKAREVFLRGLQPV